MAQQPQKIRPLFLIALVLAIVVGGALFIRGKFRKAPNPIAQTQPTTHPSTLPTTAPVVAEPSPPRTYSELVARDFPKVATTQPIEGGLNMRDWGHFPIPYAANIDRRGVLWITHPEAEATETLLQSAPTRQVNLTREHVAYAHWWFSEGGDWVVGLVTPSPRGGYEFVTTKKRQPIGQGEDYDWARAFSIPAEGKIIVPRPGRLSVFTTSGEAIVESVSPTILQNGTVQIEFDGRGYLAWVPPETGRAGSKGVVRYVDNKWIPLTPEQGWPANIVHLVPLADGTVLQIIAEDESKVRLSYAALDTKEVDETKVANLINDLSDADAQKREAAFAELTKYGPGLWPIAEKMLDSALPEAQERLKSLLKSKLTPLLGGMQLADGKLQVACRFPDGGVLFFAPNGVLLPRGDLDPFEVKPAWIVARQGYVQRPDPELVAGIDPKSAQVNALSSEWIITDATNGPQRFFGGAMVPLLRKRERKYSELMGIDARGRYVFRQPREIDRKMAGTMPATMPATRATTRASEGDVATLIIDPTLPDPIPRLPIWLILVKQGSVGWTADNWPVMKSGGGWALGTRDWKSLDENKDKVFSKAEDIPPVPDYVPPKPATAPSTHPSTTRATTEAVATPVEKPILHDADGNWYFDGKTSLKVISKDGKQINWPLPATAVGEAQPWLVRSPDGLLFLYNYPGRLLRIRPTPTGREPFEIEATFTRKIPAGTPTRLWIDPAGRIAIAFGGNQLAILFPQGYIPPPTDRIIPANEQDVSADDE